MALPTPRTQYFTFLFTLLSIPLEFCRVAYPFNNNFKYWEIDMDIQSKIKKSLFLVAIVASSIFSTGCNISDLIGSIGGGGGGCRMTDYSGNCIG